MVLKSEWRFYKKKVINTKKREMENVDLKGSGRKAGQKGAKSREAYGRLKPACRIKDQWGGGGTVQIWEKSGV